MSDHGYQGIQLSLKRPTDNALLNICGVTAEEFFAVKALLKEDPDLAGFFGGGPILTVVPTETNASNTTNSTPRPAVQAQAQSTGGEPAPVCDVCGTAKTWKPGGVSRAGKPYQGFWGCPNYRDGSHG